MLELSERLLELLFGLSSSTIYMAVGILCWAEAAFFLGFVTPGELAVAAGGVLASRGQATLGWLVAVVVVGTFTGNATGYLLGRRWGERILEWKPLQFLLGSSIGKVRDFMARRGEWAIVMSRLAAPTRIILPFLAGASGLSYRRFLLFDVPATVIWAVAWSLLGFGLAGSWRALQEVAGAAAFLVLGLFIAALVIRWLAARIAANPVRVQSGFRRLLRVTGVAWLTRRLTPTAGWLGRRFDPRLAHGLGLTVRFAVLTAAVAGVGLVMSQTRAVRGLVLLDFPVLEWMSATRTPEAVRIARTALSVFDWPEVLGLTVPLVALLAWRAGIAAALRAGVGLLGAGGGAYWLDRFVLEAPVPRAEYPSVAVAVAAALMAHAAATTARRWGWGLSVAVAAVGFFLVSAVALAAVVAGWAAPSGIALGFAIGLGWATTVELTRVPARPGPPRPAPPEPGTSAAEDRSHRVPEPGAIDPEDRPHPAPPRMESPEEDRDPGRQPSA